MLHTPQAASHPFPFLPVPLHEADGCFLQHPIITLPGHLLKRLSTAVARMTHRTNHQLPILSNQLDFLAQSKLIQYAALTPCRRRLAESTCPGISLRLGKFLCFNDLPDRLVKCRHFVHDNIPNDVIVNSKVTMDQSVTHTSHCPPFQVTVLLPEVFRYLLRCCANNLQAANKRTLQCCADRCMDLVLQG